MKKGFTLAEVLITLSIVGVVAILTIPATMRNYQKKVYVTQLQKVYSQISEAALAIMNDEHVDNFYETFAGTNSTCDTAGNCTQGLGYFINKYINPTMKDCANTGCLPTVSSYKTLSGDFAGDPAGEYCAQTQNGATICGFFNPRNTCMSIAVDVNGIEKPNIVGRDLFVMDIHEDGAISDYGSGCSAGSQGCAASQCNQGTTDGIYSRACGCLTSVIEAGWKMEY